MVCEEKWHHKPVPSILYYCFHYHYEENSLACNGRHNEAAQELNLGINQRNEAAITSIIALRAPKLLLNSVLTSKWGLPWYINHPTSLANSLRLPPAAAV